MSPSPQSEIFQAAICRIVQVSNSDIKNILKSSTLRFPQSALELHAHLCGQRREQLFARIEAFKAAVAITAPAKKVILESPGHRPIVLEVDTADESLIDPNGTLKHQQAFQKLIQLEARCQAALRLIQNPVAITDCQGWHLECNYTKPKIGIDRMEAVGALAEEIFPHPIAELMREKIAEAFGALQVPVDWEFTHEPIPGIPRQFRARTTAYGKEALTLMQPVGGYPWVS